MPITPLIDVHSHLGQFTHAPMSADGARLAALHRGAGITHGVTFSIEACYGGVDAGNRYTLDEVARQPALSAMVVAHPRHLEASARWVAAGRGNADVVGIKLHPVLGQWDILSVASFKLMDEVIAPSGYTVLSHVGNESPLAPIDKYLKLAERFPSVRFIAAHLGTGIMGLSDATIDAWRDRPLPNVWFDMGTLRAFHTGAVEAVVAAVGPDRVCFGTDAPLYHPAPFVRLLEALELPDAVKNAIASENVLNAIPQLRERVAAPRHGYDRR